MFILEHFIGRKSFFFSEIFFISLHQSSLIPSNSNLIARGETLYQLYPHTCHISQIISCYHRHTILVTPLSALFLTCALLQAHIILYSILFASASQSVERDKSFQVFTLPSVEITSLCVNATEAARLSSPSGRVYIMCTPSFIPLGSPLSDRGRVGARWTTGGASRQDSHRHGGLSVPVLRKAAAGFGRISLHLYRNLRRSLQIL